MTRPSFSAIMRSSLGYLIAALIMVGSWATIGLGQGKQLSLADILIALRSKKAVIEEKNKILTDAVNQRGVTFVLTAEIEKELAGTGATTALVDAIRVKSPKAETKPEPSPVQIASSNPKPMPPPDFAFYRGRATAALASGDLDGALIEFGKAIELKPLEASSYAERGVIYTKQDKPDLAIAEFSKAVELNPKDTASWFRRGTLNEKAGKVNDALSDYLKAVEADLTNEPAKSAAIRIKDEQTKAAQAAVSKAAPPEPKKAEVPGKLFLGALNEYTVRLAMPVYTQNDRRMGIQGKVTVSVELDAEGKVISADAKDGPKQLRMSAEDAVKRSKFKAVTAGGVAVPASGYIVFNFVSTP